MEEKFVFMKHDVDRIKVGLLRPFCVSIAAKRTGTSNELWKTASARMIEDTPVNFIAARAQAEA